MTRFIMSIEQAVGLVISSAGLANGGEVFITKMPVIRIQDLLEVMIETLAPCYGHKPQDIPVEIIGSKPGEKMYEELMNNEETRRAIELEKYFVIVPAFTSIYRQVDYTYPGVVSENVINPYNSANEKPLTKKMLKELLTTYHLLDQDLSAQNPTERYFP
jgi:FlaA1/EpsC-like NDP-sugar epimerase